MKTYFDNKKAFKTLQVSDILNCIQLLSSISGDLDSIEYPFIAITPRSTLALSDSTCDDTIYGSDRSIGKLLILTKNTWNDLTEQTDGYRLIKNVKIQKKHWKHWLQSNIYKKNQISVLHNP